MTGPIQVPPIPNVRPVFYGTANSGQERLQQSFQALLAVLQGQQKMAALQSAQAQQQATEGAAGSLLGDYLGKLGQQTVPSIQIPGTPASPGVQTQPFTAQGPLAAFRGKPGQAVYEAVKVGGNLLAPEVARIARAREPKTPSALETFTNAKGEVLSLDKTRKIASPILDTRTGQPVMARPPNPASSDRFVMTSFTDAGGQPLLYKASTGEFKVGPTGLIKAGTLRGDEQDAAMFYREAAKAWQQINALGTGTPIPGDIVKYVLAVRGAMGTQPMEKWIRENNLSEQAKQALLAWTTLLRNTIYAKSGKQVTIQEFQDAINRYLPTALDSEQTQRNKRDLLEVQTEGLYGKSFRALQADKLRGLEVPPAPSDLFQAAAEQPKSPMDGQPFVPGNPFLHQQPAPTSNAPPPLLQRP